MRPLTERLLAWRSGGGRRAVGHLGRRHRRRPDALRARGRRGGWGSARPAGLSHAAHSRPELAAQGAARARRSSRPSLRETAPCSPATWGERSGAAAREVADVRGPRARAGREPRPDCLAPRRRRAERRGDPAARRRRLRQRGGTVCTVRQRLPSARPRLRRRGCPDRRVGRRPTCSATFRVPAAVLNLGRHLEPDDPAGAGSGGCCPSTPGRRARCWTGSRAELLDRDFVRHRWPTRVRRGSATPELLDELLARHPFLGAPAPQEHRPRHVRRGVGRRGRRARAPGARASWTEATDRPEDLLATAADFVGPLRHRRARARYVPGVNVQWLVACGGGAHHARVLDTLAAALARSARLRRRLRRRPSMRARHWLSRCSPRAASSARR